MSIPALNLEQMSPFTRTLYDYEYKFLREASKTQTYARPFKVHVIARLLTLGTALLLHAEAVCRAVYICFLKIQEMFSQINEESLKRQKEEALLAYGTGFVSFFATFYQKLLINRATIPSHIQPKVQKHPPAPKDEAPPVNHREESVQVHEEQNIPREDSSVDHKEEVPQAPIAPVEEDFEKIDLAVEQNLKALLEEEAPQLPSELPKFHVDFHPEHIPEPENPKENADHFVEIPESKVDIRKESGDTSTVFRIEEPEAKVSPPPESSKSTSFWSYCSKPSPLSTLTVSVPGTQDVVLKTMGPSSS